MEVLKDSLNSLVKEIKLLIVFTISKIYLSQNIQNNNNKIKLNKKKNNSCGFLLKFNFITKANSKLSSKPLNKDKLILSKKTQEINLL